MGLELWKNVCVTFTVILLSTLVKGSLVQDVDQRPRVVVDNGDMLLVAARGKDIRFQILEGGHVYLNNEDLLQLVQTVRQAVDLLGDSEGGRLSNLQRTITKLNNAIFGKSGLGTRVSQLEQGLGNSSSIGEVSGGVDAKIKNLNTKVAGLRRMILALRNKLKANECSSNPCRNGGTCEDSYDSFICRCPPNWEGTLCDTDVNECARFAGTDLGCQNGATCINKPGTYECSCATGWFGIHCTQTSNACTSSASRDLCGHGLCVSQPNSHLGFSCICEQGWTKDLVTQACTQDVDECASNHPSCSRDPPVACINVPGSFYCGGCPQGYTGNGYYCADIDECQVNNGGCSMNPTVQCINTQGSRKCGICPPGYQGDGITCTYHGVCQINNGGCHHLARCVENQAIGPSFVQCICPAGYAGSGVGESGCVAGTAVLPSHSACSSNPCIHGTCTPSGSSYICSCIIGYTGPTCAIAVNPCANNPCKNGGTCVPHQGTFHCRCPSNSTGANCEETQMSCGGRLHSEEGSLSFPPSSTSQTYVPNLSCAWVIVTNASKVLNVTFTSFHLEVAPDCNYDWLQIHDGRSAGDRLIDRYCGTELPNNGSIISTHNTLYLWFRSDHSINKDGFSITWKSVDPVCGGNVEVSHGSISSPGYPGKYPKNRDCLWRLTAPLTRRIQFNFITVKLENHPNCSYDFLEIKDGGTSHSPVLEKLCTTSTPAPVMSSGPVVEIRFHSDDQGNDGGFLISYNTVPGIAGCGGILSGTSGTISCPMENGVYRHNLDCEWIIQVPASSRIRITFDTFELESSRDCRFDRLEVREGKEPSSPLVGRYCGNVPPRPYLSKSNYLTIIFQSDWSGSGNGFQIYYEEICGGIYGDPSGVITSPNYPENYPTNKQCVYEIAQPLGKAITLKFYDFQMESHYRCSYDYLEIRDGHDSTSPLMGTYCDHIPPTVVSTYNFLWLKFQTDFSRQRRGFYANYTTQDVSCGGILKNQTGTVESPHYPNLYRHNELCRWIIVADVGQVIQLTWTNFELERSYNCVFDSLEIYDNDTMANGSTLIGRYCGSQKPPDITSMNNILTLVFATDSSRRSSGFQATFTQVDSSQICGGNYFSAVGTLRSPNYPNQYPHSKDCVWILKVPYGQQLKLNITDFHLEYHDNCRWDYLEIRNGGSATAPLIGKYCGTDIPPDIQAISNQLYLRFKSDYSRSDKGFEISWDGTSRGCGGTLTSPQGSIKSPNYPEPYEGQSECFWKISTSRGSTIQAVFVDVQLESSPNCMYDYVAIYDGMDASAKLLGRFCQMSNAIAVQSTSNHMFIKFRSDINNEGIGFHINYATMCITDVIGFQGVIESPNFPSMYPSHLDCKWNIKVPKGNKVNMTFSHFELEREPCRFDYLQVSEAYHGEAIYQPLTEKLCGSRLPPPVHSTSDKVQVSMVTDYSVGHSGFRLEWLLDGCGGRLTHPEGEFTSPGYPGSYKDEVECHWYITVPLHLSVELTIHDLVMEGRMDCRFDSLTIYGGPDTSMVLVPPLCHSLTEPLVVTSSGNNMVVIFTSDVSYSGRGFRASYVGVPSRCGGLFTAPAGRIQSRNYPNNYDPHDDCLWLIKVAANHVVQLTFIDFDLEMHANCSFDYVKLFDGNTTESPVIATLCGSRMPNITTYRSTSNTLLVRMKADGSRSLKGFAANYTTACGANIITDDYGIIDLHPSVNVNEENLNCSWVIIAAQPDERITFTITHMDLSPSMENSHESCEFAFVEVRDGNDKDAPLKGRYCGSRAPPQISSVGSALFVHMVSMYGAHYGHFSASYAVYSAGCGADLTSEHGSFASPHYPSTYPLNSECVWKITSAPGNRVMVNFRSFALEQSASCNKDYLEIREGDGAGRVIGTYCTELPSNITASQTLWIKFHSDGDETAAGFIADYSLVHGNDLNGPSGEIASPLYPRSYIQEGDFSWRVTVQFGYAISITFTDFFIEKYMDFCDLYLAIYEGYDESGVEIFRGCGYLLPDPVTSSSNVVYIMMHTMAMYHGSYFKLNWLQVERVEAPRPLYPNRPPVPGCGGRIYLSDWDNGSANNSYLLQSPGYPNGYARMLNCEWIIETPSTSHTQMIVRDMDLESYEYCFSDYVTVYEGVGNTENWRQLKTMCLSNASNEGPIDASSLMKVVFHSDYSYNKTGFSSRIYSVCGGTINAPSGVIEVHNMTNQFSDRGRYMVQCQWNVTVRSGRTISVMFDRFQVPADFSGTCSNSYLMLRNGHSQDSPILGNGKYCSNTIPEIPHTTSNYLFISYYGFSNSEGFKMRFSEVAVTCGGQYTLTARNNRMSISSPNYPNIPIPHTECTWIIMAPGGERIQVDFNDTFNFNISPGGECTLEYVELRDGGTEISPLIGRYCYSAPSTQTTTGNVLFLRFFTDTDDPHTGFQASISLARCGGTVRGYDGEISSPGYPGEYPSNIECIWRIVGYRNHLLELQFKDLHLPTSPLGCSNVDNVKITEVLPYNRTENVVQTICGTGPQPNIQLGSNEALITFKTGPKSPFPFTNRGFYMNYSSSYDICGGELSTPEGQIQSPGYPNGLPHHRYCEWDITVPRGRRITVNILDLDMDLRAGSNLMFFNRDFSYFITSLKSNSSVRQIESSGNKMRIYYYARSSAGRRGFQATYHSNQPEVCGGDILQDSGTISLSASRDNIRSLYCEWRRTNTNPGNQTFAIIISNAIVGYNINMPCSYRGTKLYAYVDENSLLLTEICRNITQGPVIILSPFLSTTFVGSQGVRGGPLNFTAQYQVLPCGGVLTGPEQIISSPGFPSNYAPNMHCAWSVSFPSGQAISVHFLALNLETNCGHDYVKIHSGASPTAPRIGSYCGTTIPQDFVAQSNTLWIEFHSDKEVQSQGFKLHLTPVTAGCGGIMHTNTGMASSPNFPNKYPNNAECEWDIRVENGYFIQLQFVERFKLEDSSGCANDFVEVFDYREGNYVSHGKFCGANTPPFFNSTSTRMKVLFRSNGDIAADGFKMQWNVHCGGLIENVTSGTITSPGFPHAYENGLYCNYTVVVPQKPIKASFDFFHIEDAYQGCRYDNVTLYILESYSHSFYKIGEYCGINAPPEFSAMGAFSLVFETDSWGRFDGFVLRFEVVTCGGDLHDPGRIELPKLYTPYFYSSINCTWTITAPANLVVLARFTELVADRYRSCYSDNSVNVYDGPYAIDDKRLGRFCGNISQSPPVLHSSGNTMVIQYLTFTYIRFQHFEADIIFTYGESVGCGGRINATSSAQTIRSPDVDRDNQYEANLDCHWLIRAEDGQVLNVRMTSFQLEPCNNTSNNSSNYCGCDFLEVYDGPSQYSALIDRYCGSEIPSAIISSTNHLWLRFVSDGERNGRGFVAEVTSVNSICGPAHLNVTATLKELTSPNYPANAPVNLRCRWLLEDDSNYYFGRIAVHVEDVDIQGGGLECTNAKLEIADASVADIISEGLGENFVYSGRSTHAHSIRYGSMWPVSSVTFCGHVVPHNFYSDVGRVYVSLVTSSVPSKGFKLQYSLGGCNRNYTSVQGRIKLTQLPASCDILIETSPNRTISLFFSENSLGNCENSGIEVKDGASTESPMLQRLCGYSTFNPIFSTGPNLRIHIWNTVHNSYNYYNLDMTYTTTDQGRGCGGELFNYGGIFTSPFYPSNNRNSSVCRWHVTVPANLQAALYFSVFDLGSSTTCSSDFVEILEVDLTSNTETVRSRYCGGDNPAAYISPNNVFVLRYTVSVHNEGSGWVAHFMGKPPGSQLYEEMTAFDSNSDYY